MHGLYDDLLISSESIHNLINMHEQATYPFYRYIHVHRKKSLKKEDNVDAIMACEKRFSYDVIFCLGRPRIVQCIPANK